jgi:hypothetical protein
MPNENHREIPRVSRLPARTGDVSYRNTVSRSTETLLPSPFSRNPHFPALRFVSLALSEASRRKQTPHMIYDKSINMLPTLSNVRRLSLGLLFVSCLISSCGDPEMKRILAEEEKKAKFRGAALLVNAGFTNPYCLPQDAPTFFYQIHTEQDYGIEDRIYWKARYSKYYYAVSFLEREGVAGLELWTLEDAIWRALEDTNPRAALERIAKSVR